jgi:hypothetical protein
VVGAVGSLVSLLDIHLVTIKLGIVETFRMVGWLEILGSRRAGPLASDEGVAWRQKCEDGDIATCGSNGLLCQPCAARYIRTRNCMPRNDLSLRSPVNIVGCEILKPSLRVLHDTCAKLITAVQYQNALSNAIKANSI